MKLFEAVQPKLAKFCPAEFNITKGCNTVRFGTLYDFRIEENEKLRDEGEGTFQYTVRFPQATKVSKEWLSAFSVEGEGRFHIGSMEMGGQDVLVESMTLSGSTHNCWIYCISKNADIAGNISETHQDKWLIPHDKLQALGAYFASLLWSDLKPADIPPEIAAKHTLLEIQQRMGLHFECKEVEYAPRDILITSEADLPVDQVLGLKERIAFIKPEKFVREEEVRMAFWLTFDGKKISIVNKPKIIGLRPFDKVMVD